MESLPAPDYWYFYSAVSLRTIFPLKGWNRYLTIFFTGHERIKTVVVLQKHPIMEKLWMQHVDEKIWWKKFTCLVLSGKPAKDSTNQGWFVEYGAVAAPLPVCHPFMPASLSFLLPEDIHIRSAKKKPTFRYGSELLFSRKGSLWVHNPWHCHFQM